MFGFPLLLIPFAIFNIIIFLMPGVRFDTSVTSVALLSGTDWTITFNDILITLGILLVLFEVVKIAQAGGRYLTDHLLSFIVLAGATAEFLLLPQFGNSTFFLLCALAFADFFMGIALRARRFVHQPATEAVPEASAAPTPLPEPARVDPPPPSPSTPAPPPPNAPAAEPAVSAEPPHTATAPTEAPRPESDGAARPS